ncbi:MAG: DUF2304 family protein, partial [Proteobacteria bacterium]
NSIVWWAVAFFIILALVQPSLLKPLVDAMGIKVVSNFVLASLVMFLFIQVLELTGETTAQSRKFRQLVSNIASEQFFQKLPRSRSNSIHPRMRVLVVLPCYNEEEALPTTIAEMKELLASDTHADLDIHMCVVNDGSRDSSRFILEEEIPYNYVSHSANIGVSGVLLTGFAIAKQLKAHYVVQCDSDGQHPMHLIPEMVREAHRGEYDLLIGSRFYRAVNGNALESTTIARVSGIVLIRRMLGLFGVKARVQDPTSGFRVYSEKARETLVRQMPDEYPEPESVALLAQIGLKIGETNVKMIARTTGVSSINGLKSVTFMTKVLTALIGLRLRTLWGNRSI